jgi:hypothetical protein
MKTLPIFYYRGRLWATILPNPMEKETRALGFALEPVQGKPNYAKFCLTSALQLGRINEEALNLIWSKDEISDYNSSKTH